jgi:hypothetical protein
MKASFFWILLISTLLTLPPGASAGILSGKIEYVDKIFDFSTGGAGYTGTENKPVRYCYLELRNLSDNTLLGSADTDADGEYQLFFTGSGQMTAQLLVIAKSTTSPWTSVEVRDNSNRLQSVAIGPFSVDAAENATRNVVVPTDDATVRLGGIFNIMDCILQAGKTVTEQTGERTPSCTIYWEHGSTNGTYYVPETSTLYLLGGNRANVNAGDDDSYDDTVIIHEYGHFIADQFSVDRSPGGAHSFTGYYTPTLAWSEGWANAFQSFVRNSALYWDSLDGDENGFQLDFETGSRNGVPAPELKSMKNEGAIACVLYDLFDGPNSLDTSPGEDDDGVEFGLAPIWEIFTNGFNSQDLVTFEDFSRGWEDSFAHLPYEAIFSRWQMEVAPFSEQESVHSRTGLYFPISRFGASLEDTLTVSLPGQHRVLSGGVQVWVGIRHSNRTGLQIRLIPPRRDAVTLKAAPGGASGADVMEWYGFPLYEAPANSLDTLAGLNPQGEWTLEVLDQGSTGSGILSSWRLRLATEPSPDTLWQMY